MCVTFQIEVSKALNHVHYSMEDSCVIYNFLFINIFTF